MKSFLSKNQKFVNVGKNSKYDKEGFLSMKNRSHLLKLHLYQIGKAQNMSVVAGRLVKYELHLMWCLFALFSNLAFFLSFFSLANS